MTDNNDLQTIKQLLDTAENNIRQAKNLIFVAEFSKKAEDIQTVGSDSVIEGVFDGEMMIGPDKKKYPVQPNYASKSKLVPGDVLKLNIQSDGSFLFKQISPVKRKKVIGELEELTKGKFAVNTEGKRYRVLLASVTYFKAEAGDKITILVPEEGESEWAAIENRMD